MSTTTPATGAAPSVIATAHPPTIPAEQELLVGHLSEDTRARLAGDHPDRAVIRQQRPGMVLALGVLPALPQPDPAGTETAQQLARRIGRPPSQMGASFHVQPDGEEVVLGVEADFSVYVQNYPDRAEQAAARGVATAAADADDDSPPTGDATTAPASAPAPSSGSSDLAESGSAMTSSPAGWTCTWTRARACAARTASR